MQARSPERPSQERPKNNGDDSFKPYRLALVDVMHPELNHNPLPSALAALSNLTSLDSLLMIGSG